MSYIYYVRLCVAIFSDFERKNTNTTTSLDIYMNNECILSKKPLMGLQNDNNNNQDKIDPQLSIYQLPAIIRNKHTAGEITCLCIEEYVSLPPDAEISVKLNLNEMTKNQGFFSLKKI